MVAVALRLTTVGSLESLVFGSSEVSLTSPLPDGLLATPTTLFTTLPLSKACWSIV